MKIKIIDMNNGYRTVYDIDFPISNNSNLIWLSFSEEGALYSFDNEGIMRTLNPLNKQWVPVLDFRFKFPDTYR